MFVQLVTHGAGHHGVQGVVGVGTHSFSATLAGATGRTENCRPSQCPSADLGCPSVGLHLQTGVWPLSPRFPYLKILRARDHAVTILSMEGTGRKVVYVLPTPRVLVTHHYSAHSQRGDWWRAGRRWRWRPYSSISHVGTGSCTPECPIGRPRGCWAAGTVSSCTAPSGGCSAASRHSPASPVLQRRQCPATCKKRRPMQ